MDTKEILWDRLAGMLMIYVDNYFIKKSGGRLKIQPSYEVDYEISESILKEISKTPSEEDRGKIWYHGIAACRDINDLPETLQELVVQFLPKFFQEYPMYCGEDCLKRR